MLYGYAECELSAVYGKRSGWTDAIHGKKQVWWNRKESESGRNFEKAWSVGL